MIITHNIQTDLIDAPSIPRIHVVQGDYYSRSVAVTLLAGGKPWSVPEDAFVAIRYCKPDGTKGSYDTLPDGTPAWKLENGNLILYLAPQMTTASGCVSAQVEMVQDNQILATFSFQILVARDDSGTFLTSQDYFNWQQWVNAQLDTRLQQAVEGNLFTGATPNLTIGTVTTLEPDAAASASIRGTPENPILDLMLPKGADAAIDATLTKAGQAADAGVVGNALSERIPGKTAQWLPANGIALADLPNGYFAYSTDPNRLPAIGLPSNYSSYGTLFGIRSTAYALIQFVDKFGNLAIYDTENGRWLPHSPMMSLSTEYVTTERWQGNIVYAKWLALGKAGNSTTIRVHHYTPCSNIIECRAVLDNRTAVMTLAYGSGTKCWVEGKGGSGVIAVGTDGDFSTYDVYALIKYTK